jgi:hypothetical protein
VKPLPAVKTIILGVLMFSGAAFGQEALKIMPLGNSITFDSNVADITNPRKAGDRIAYRYKLYQLLTDEGYTFDFVGNRNAGFFHFPDGDNAGFPGIETSGLLELIRTGYNNIDKEYEISPGNYLEKYKPDIILLHIGTNGLQDNTDAENFKNDVNEMLNEVDAIESTYSMTIPVFLAQIINRTPYHSPTTSYNNKLSQMVSSRSGDEIKLVNMETGAGIVYQLEPSGDMADTWHPNNSGYEKMAQEWFDALENYNFREPVVSQIPSQQINENETFDTIYLDDYVFDPQERDDEISWLIVSSTFENLHSQIVPGRKLVVTSSNQQWNGTESLTLRATDPSKGGQQYHSNQVEVSFTVLFVNDTAIITGQRQVNIPEDSNYTISFDDLFVEDADNTYPDDFTLHIENGEYYTLDENTITPDENYYGELTIPVRVHDGTVYSKYFDFTISVDEINDAPVITGQHTVNTYEDYAFILGLEHLHVEDVDNTYPDDFSITIDTGANYTLNQDTIVPDENFFGTLEIPVTVSDGTDNSNTFLLTVSVLSVNDIPVLMLPQTIFDEDTAINIYVTTFDADGDQDISVSFIERPSWLFYVRSEMRLYGTPKFEDVGEHEATFRLSDGKTSYDTTIVLEVVHVNDPPVIEEAIDSLKTNMNEELTISLSDLVVKDSDNVYPDDFYLILLNGNHYRISETDDATIKPDFNFTGKLKVKTMVNDGFDNSNVKEIDVSVLLINNVPGIHKKVEVIVYPNPVSQYLNIESRQPFENIELFSLPGNLLYRFDGQNKTRTHQVNVTSYLAGVYILKVHFTNKESIVRKVIIKK